MSVDVDEVVENFFVQLIEPVTSQSTYPLFDASTGSLVASLLEESTAVPSASAVRRGKQVALAVDLFERLPLFEGA